MRPQFFSVQFGRSDPISLLIIPWSLVRIQAGPSTEALRAGVWFALHGAACRGRSRRPRPERGRLPPASGLHLRPEARRALLALHGRTGHALPEDDRRA